jgi:hypothetical protein
MSTDWAVVKKALYPMKDDEDLRRRLHCSFAYPFVRETFNFSMPELINYTRVLLGGDSRARYTDYITQLVRIMAELQQAGVSDLQNLLTRVETRERMEAFAEQSGIAAHETATVLKYLVYWFIPMEKLLSGLVHAAPEISAAIQKLRELGIRTNLDLLQQGLTVAGRQALVDSSGLPAAIIGELVNRADFSRLPWASKATISNIIGAGYGSLVQLANANPEQLFADFFRYGKSIGKNLKLGNEIENSQRIAKIVPVLLQPV